MRTERHICSRLDIHATYHWVQESRVGRMGLCWMEELDLVAGRVTLWSIVTRRGLSLLGKGDSEQGVSRQPIRMLQRWCVG